MLASERFLAIVETTNKKGFVSTKELSVQLDVTETTIRRDCEELEQQGLLIRVHGGAKSINQKEILSNKDEKAMKYRNEEFSYEKDIVCKKAASFVKDGDCVFLDGGSSVLGMLKYLKGKRIKIVTHSTFLANAFDDEFSELFVIGGKYIPQYGMSIGPIAITDLERFNFDFSFISCAGVDSDKHIVYTTEMDTLAVKQKSMALANKKYLLTDSSKFGVKGFCNFTNCESFDAVICNHEKSIDVKELPQNYIIVE